MLETKQKGRLYRVIALVCIQPVSAYILMANVSGSIASVVGKLSGTGGGLVKGRKKKEVTVTRSCIRARELAITTQVGTLRFEQPTVKEADRSTALTSERRGFCWQRIAITCK